MKLIMENWRKFINEAKNKDGKEQGADGKACWDGHKHTGIEDGKDKCAKVNEDEEGQKCKKCSGVDPDAVCNCKLEEETIDEKKKKACKPSKGKRFAKRVDGKCRSFGQKGKAKDGGDRIRPGTEKGHAYCARSAKIKKCKNPPCANTLSRKKWKCQGDRSVAQ